MHLFLEFRWVFVHITLTNGIKKGASSGFSFSFSVKMELELKAIETVLKFVGNSFEFFVVTLCIIGFIVAKALVEKYLK